MAFGDKWRKHGAAYWDAMAARCAGLQVDEALAATVQTQESLIEIGCGAGHTAELLFARGFAGRYWGCDISQAAASAARTRLGPRATVEVGRFEDLAAAGKVPHAEVVVARSVLQHQGDWLPFATSTLEHAPRALFVVIRDEFVKPDGEHEKLSRGSYFDVRLSIEAMKREAAATGLHVDVQQWRGRIGPEVLLTVQRAR